ncbi:hypothetical protein MMC30_001597 [Trapelia coarctata]|nr:hypothetical protein [Trapelia coarctata]
MDVNIAGITPALLLGVMWVGIALATIFTIIKTTIRLHISNRLFADDVLVYIALTILIVLGVLYTLVNDTIFEIILVGMGKMPPTPEFYVRMTFFLKVQFAIIVLFWTALWAVKFSFLVYYKKLFIGLPGNMQKCWWAVSIFALCAYIGCWITQLTSCEPMSTYFNGQCVTPRDIYVSNLSLYYATSVDIICDVMIMALPLRLLWNLQINAKQKCALAGIFSLGVIIIIFAVVRVIETSATFNHVNPMWLALWSMIEASVGKSDFFGGLQVAHLCAKSQSTDDSLSCLSGGGILSRQRKIRLDTLASNEADAADFSEYSEAGYGTDGSGGHTSQKGQTGYSAAAEGLKDLELGVRDRIGGDSREHILPKLPKNSVHVRNDFYMTSEIV